MKHLGVVCVAIFGILLSIISFPIILAGRLLARTTEAIDDWVSEKVSEHEDEYYMNFI